MAGNPAWKEGKSGNPGGRPKRPPEEMEKWRKAAEKNLDILIEIRDKPNTKESDRIRAIEMIEDRTYGKAIQQTQMLDENDKAIGGSVVNLSFIKPDDNSSIPE